jgi:hypothetical protein
MTATADENRTIVQGSLAYFGTYTLDDAKKMMVFKTDASTYPNWAPVHTPIGQARTCRGNTSYLVMNLF